MAMNITILITQAEDAEDAKAEIEDQHDLADPGLIVLHPDPVSGEYTPAFSAKGLSVYVEEV